MTTHSKSLNMKCIFITSLIVSNKMFTFEYYVIYNIICKISLQILII